MIILKRFVVAVVLLLCIIAGSFFVTACAEKAIDETKQAILSCAEKEKDISLDIIKLKNALSVWDKNKKILYAFMFHEDFTEFENNIAVLRYMCDFPDSDKIRKISYESAVMLDSIKEKNRANPEIIF